MGKIDPSNQKELYRFAERYIDDNMIPGDKRMKSIRDATYAYVLGGNLRQYAVQMTQFPTVIVPEMLKFGSVGDV